MVFALIGNQNCGKTTLFNQLTGSNQHTGNFPGVTVDKKEGYIKSKKNFVVVDLPGIYSLSAYTCEEIVTRNFLLKEKPCGIINIIDGTNIERNLYLTLQLMELEIPMVVALNMMDEVEKNGNDIKVAYLEELLGIDIIPISALKNQGIDELIEQIAEINDKKTSPPRIDYDNGYARKAIKTIAHLIKETANSHNFPTEFCATKLFENDELMIKELQLDCNTISIINKITQDTQHNLGTDKYVILAEMRYNYIEKICKLCVSKKNENRQTLRSAKLDKIFTHKYFAIPVFFLIMILIFYLTFGIVDKSISTLFEKAITSFIGITNQFLLRENVNEVLRSLIVDGVLNGVGSVLSFLPTIVALFFFLSILEDSGYMARVAFVMDRLLRKIGLSGKSFVPLLIGFGCSVPAIMATRTLPSRRDRKMTIMMIPFISCSAKMPIYALFTSLLFKGNEVKVMCFLYFFGIICAIICGFLLKSTIFKGDCVAFVMELPNYRLPSLKTALLHMWEKAKDFLFKAFTIIFFASVAIWVLQSFDFSFKLVSQSENSILAQIGKLIAPIFAPLGFNDWRIATALITGLSAKETVVSTLNVLLGELNITDLFSSLSGFSFLIFTLLYMPCVAAMAAVNRELGKKSAIYLMIFQTSIAWIASFIIYNIGSIFIK